MRNNVPLKTAILAITTGMLVSGSAFAKTAKTKQHKPSELQTYGELKKKGFPSAKILGYDIQGCHSLESGRNLCNTKDIQTIINRAKSMKEPNFDHDKKLVQFKHQTKRYDYETLRDEFDEFTTELTTMNITDIIVVDEKAKKMYVSDAFAYSIDYNKPAPSIYTLKDSSWYCLKEDGTDFYYTFRSDDYTADMDIPHSINYGKTRTSDDFEDYSKSWACNGFINGKFHDYDNDIAPKVSSYAWLDKKTKNVRNLPRLVNFGEANYD